MKKNEVMNEDKVLKSNLTTEKESKKKKKQPTLKTKSQWSFSL